MAATQAEPQQNDVNREIIQQEQSQVSGSNSLQNGTDKIGVRGVVGSDVAIGKGVKSGQNSSIDMSQYRPESGPPVNNSEPSSNNSEDNGSKLNNSDKGFSHNAEQGASDVSYGKCPPESAPNMQGYSMSFPQRGNYMHNDPANPIHMGADPMHHQGNSYHFNPGLRHAYSGSQPLSLPPRPSSGGSIPSGGFPGHSQPQRFMPNQGIASPPTGPTPTLNQLLKSSNRYPNNYSEYNMPKSDQATPGMPYNQSWPTRAVGPYPQSGPYRNQPPPVTGGGQGAGSGTQGPGGPPQGAPAGRPYPGYPQSPSQSPFPSPYRPHPYQISSSGAGGAGSNGGGGYDRVGSWSPGAPQSSAQPIDNSHPSSPGPNQGQGGPPSQQQRPQQSPSAPDTAELTGANSNDSSSGGAGGGGTPNSQAGGPLRPSPSPTGSTGSRSMSPAVTLPSQSNQASQPGSVSQSSGAPSGAGSQTTSVPSGQPVVATMPPRPPSSSDSSGNGPTRLSHSPMANQGGAAGYPVPGSGAPSYIKMGGMMQSGHLPAQSQQMPPYSPSHHQYSPQGNYRPVSGYPYPGGPQGPYPPGPHRPPGQPMVNHVQYQPYPHKVGYGGGGMPPSPGGYNANSMGPPGGALHPGMPPPPPPHHDSPMPPPQVSAAAGSQPELHDSNTPTSTTPATGTVTPSMNNSGAPGGVTSIITTGPDGASLDEASQQSTLSNASAASGEEMGTPGASTPGKPGPRSKEGLVYPGSHPTTPQSTAPSPASLNSIHEEYPPDHSPTWSRTPNSPVYNSHVTQDLYRPKKHDSLGKLYEMDESVDRKMWLDKLLQFMDDRGSPISACPTISKNPLDLFRLYMLVKERGGFIEVTKNKVWKDIAGLLGIGASSSAAYTLRKHYTKNLLPFECHFDRGGIDPQPIINQVEASSKKKTTKAAPVPSPGSSNSQDSFQGPGSGGNMDGSYPGYGYPHDYNAQRPPSQSNQGVQPGYPAQGGSYGQYGEQYNPAGYGGYPGRPVYPGYPEGERYQQDQYGRYIGGYPGAGAAAARGPGYGPAPAGAPAQPPSSNQSTTPPATSPAPPAQPTPPPAGQDYYRPPSSTPDGYQPYPGGKAMPPPQPTPPRRHPDFVKEPPQQPNQQPPPQQYPPYRPPPPPNMYPGWSGNSAGGQYRPNYPAGSVSSGWPATNSPRPGPPSAQWGYQSGWSQRPARPPFRPEHPNSSSPNSQINSKPYPPMAPPGKVPGMGPYGPQPPKRELIFPPDSVESTTPILYKRRRLAKGDVAPIEAWRIMMALKSGLLSETTWALDVLNILLFDDNSIAYFGLIHLPGLLDILLEHMKRALQDMLEPAPGHPAAWYEAAKDKTEIDLGAPPPPDPSQRVTFLQSNSDLTMRSRKGHPVSIISSNEDIFVTDDPRSWDEQDSPEDPIEQDHTKYIVTCFRSEVCNIPFVRMIPGKKDPDKGSSESPWTLSPSQKPVVEDSCEPCDKVCIKKSPSFTLSRIKTDPHEDEGSPDPTEKKAEEVSIVKEEKKEEDMEVKSVKEELPNLKIRDPAGTLKRRRISDYEDECYTKDEASLYLVTESQDTLARRCICISTILRNLTFVPGNESEFSKSGTFLGLVGKLLLLHHEHPPKTEKEKNYSWEDDTDFTDSCSSLQGESEWWWEFLHHLRENALVALANICGQVDLGMYPEDISRPILDGLLHWAVCPAAHGQDPFPTVSPSSSLSPQRLALEALCKLCVTDSNVDLVIATPPYCRLERLSAVLTKLLCRSEEQVLREFGVNLLFYLGAADSGMARTIALQPPCVSLLVGFIEQAEAGAANFANTQGMPSLRDNPDQAMGTSVDMVRRAARALLALSRHPANRVLVAQQEARLLSLVMSQVLDQATAATLARVLYQVSRPTPPSPIPS